MTTHYEIELPRSVCLLFNQTAVTSPVRLPNHDIHPAAHLLPTQRRNNAKRSRLIISYALTVLLWPPFHGVRLLHVFRLHEDEFSSILSLLLGEQVSCYALITLS
jgi:hypothetical protein